MDRELGPRTNFIWCGAGFLLSVASSICIIILEASFKFESLASVSGETSVSARPALAAVTFPFSLCS